MFPLILTVLNRDYNRGGGGTLIPIGGGGGGTSQRYMLIPRGFCPRSDWQIETSAGKKLAFSPVQGFLGLFRV